MENQPKKFRKITNGYVIQHFERGEDGIARCVSQDFTAGDICDYETDSPKGDGVIVLDQQLEEYMPFEMKQPRKKRVKKEEE